MGSWLNALDDADRRLGLDRVKGYVVWILAPLLALKVVDSAAAGHWITVILELLVGVAFLLLIWRLTSHWRQRS